MATLFTPFRLREIELKDPIVVSPMCAYSAVDGHPQTWHLVHLGSRAVGGAALVFTEATAVEARGRISPTDTGLYLDSHIGSWPPIVDLTSSLSIGCAQLSSPRRRGGLFPWSNFQTFKSATFKRSFKSFRMRTYQQTPRFARFWPKLSSRNSFRIRIYRNPV
jgi:NADH:flavin oxidoreductase / NADH oxidase family